jgi:ATP-dependent Clp protease ATP-binding subunit ClpA
MQNNPEIEQIIDAAVKLARDRHHEYVMTEHVLLSMIRTNHSVVCWKSLAQMWSV